MKRQEHIMLKNKAKNENIIEHNAQYDHDNYMKKGLSGSPADDTIREMLYNEMLYGQE